MVNAFVGFAAVVIVTFALVASYFLSTITSSKVTESYTIVENIFPPAILIVFVLTVVGNVSSCILTSFGLSSKSLNFVL